MTRKSFTSTVLLCFIVSLSFNASAKTGERFGDVRFVGTGMPPSDTTVYDTLSCPDPSPEAVALYRYLQDMSGKKILSGQMWAPWGIDEINYLQNVTGKLPAVRGADLITESANDAEIQNLVNWWNRGGIPTLMWHWGAPGVGEGYENSKAEIDIDKCFQEGTAEYAAMWRELKLKADHLQVLRDAHVPVLWRPFHELNGSWFWWGKQGPERFKKLWKTMYDYFVYDRGLNNLIWVLCYMDVPDGDWYPGDAYVDIAGADTYKGGADIHDDMYHSVQAITGHPAEPVAYHECGVPPNPDRCIENKVMWSWWMIWHTTWLTGNDKEYLKYVFNHQLVVTLDEVPDIMATYSWDKNCPAAHITPAFQVDDNGWQAGNTIFVDSGTVATFLPEADMSGSWHWTGCGVSGSESQQTVPVDKNCIMTAEFTSECGALTSQTFNIINKCTSYNLTPYLRVDGNDWQKASSVAVTPGTALDLAPESAGSGTWKWNGCGTSGNERVQTIIPNPPCQANVTFTNNCGETGSISFNISECLASVISPYVQVAGGQWEWLTDIRVDAGTVVHLSPYALNMAGWSWTGCGLNGSSQDQYLIADSTCTATVSVTNDCGFVSSLDFNIEINPDETGYAPMVSGARFSISPNPCSGILHINCKPGLYSVQPVAEIINPSGTMVMKLKLDEENIPVDVSKLLPGIYVLRVISHGQLLTERFVKAE